MPVNIYISIISHDQHELIEENFSNFPKQIDDFNIKLSILDNTGSKKLKEFCKKSDLFYHKNDTPKGFGENHNKMFSFLDIKDKDIFIVCNPDIKIEPSQLKILVENFAKEKIDIGAPKSYLDKKSGFLDYPDRYFPYLLNFIVSIATGKRLHYGKNDDQEYPQWVSGSFILFKPKVFRELGGFDEDYFMYCEDIDICFRAKQKGYLIKLDKKAYIEHNSRMASRKLLSQSIVWHMRSAWRFSMKSKRIFGLSLAKKANNR